MPYRNEVQPVNLFGDYIAGKNAAIDQQGAMQGNALRGLQVQRAQGLNALAQNPTATPEQYARAGDPATAGVLNTMNQQGQIDKQQAVQHMVGIAQKALTIQDPAQRKGFIQQAGQMYGPSFQALGADMSQFQAMLAMPDDQLAQKLQQVAQLAAPQKPIEVAPGASLVTPNAQGGYTPQFTAPDKASSAPGAIQEYEYAKKQGYTGSFQQYQLQMKQAGAQQINLPSGYKWNADGSMAPIPGGPADPAAKNKPPTEADKKNAVLFSSMTNAEDQIAKLEAAPGGATDTSSIGNQMLGSNPVTKTMQSDAFRKYESAALRWSANLLYLKSGATATPEEVQSTRKQFFPQPGDGLDVKAQKEQARQQEVEAVRQNMVPGAAPRVPAQDAGPAPSATGPNGEKIYYRNGAWGK